VSCIEPSDQTSETLRLLADGPQPAERLPAVGLEELRRLQWVMGGEVVELAGIGYYHAGTATGGLLGSRA
jgi:hypothetical protein